MSNHSCLFSNYVPVVSRNKKFLRPLQSNLRLLKWESKIPFLICYVFFLFILGFGRASSLAGQSLTLGQDASNPYQTLSPTAYIRQSVVQSLENELEQTAPSYRQILARGNGELERYYTQIRQHKRSLYGKQNELKRETKYDENTLRLLTLIQKGKLVQPYLLRHSPDLFRLHLVVAKSYSALDYSRKALAHYSYAFRYIIIEPLSLEQDRQLQQKLAESLTAKNPTTIAPTNNLQGPKLDMGTAPIFISPEEKDKRYLWMQNHFASEIRLAEEDNAEFRSTALRFRSLFKDYLQLKKDYEQVVRKLAIAEDRIAHNRLSAIKQRAQAMQEPAPIPKNEKSFTTQPTEASIRDLRKRKSSLKVDLRKSREALEAIRKGIYQRYLEKHREFYGDAAFRMAKEIYLLEQIDKVAFDEKNQPSYEREQGKANSLVNRASVGGLSGFRSILQFAHKIDPFHMDAVRLLAKRFRMIRNLEQAVHFTRFYLKLAPVVNPGVGKQELRDHALYLAGLYMEQKRHLKAVESYELFLRLQPQEEQRLVIIKQLADLHYTHTGRLERASAFYQEYVAATEAAFQGLSIDKEKQKLYDATALRYNIFMNLAAISRKKEKQQQEWEFLQQARELYINLEQTGIQMQTKIQGLQNYVFELKQQVQQEEPSRAVNVNASYRLERANLLARQEELGQLKIKLTSLDYPKLLERMAWLAYKGDRWLEAERLYKELIRKSTGIVNKRARTNLESIQKKLGNYIK